MHMVNLRKLQSTDYGLQDTCSADLHVPRLLASSAQGLRVTALPRPWGRHCQTGFGFACLSAGRHLLRWERTGDHPTVVPRTQVQNSPLSMQAQKPGAGPYQLNTFPLAFSKTRKSRVWDAIPSHSPEGRPLHPCLRRNRNLQASFNYF